MPGRVVNVRGTSGSGKSTITRKILDECQQVIKLFEAGRRKPIAYRGMFQGNPLVILGHYEIPTGGCDTISSQDHIFGLAQRAAEDGADVIFEGRIVSCDFRRTLELHKTTNLLVVHIDLPVEVSLDWVNHRRREKAEREGKEFKPVKPANTITNDKSIRSAIRRLREQGVLIKSGDREEVEKWLRQHLS